MQVNSRQIALKISKRWVGRICRKIGRVERKIDVLDNQMVTRQARKWMKSCAAFLRVSHCVIRNFMVGNHGEQEVK